MTMESFDNPQIVAASETAPPRSFDGLGSAAEGLQMWQFTVENANDPVIITSTDLDRPGPLRSPTA